MLDNIPSLPTFLSMFQHFTEMLILFQYVFVNILRKCWTSFLSFTYRLQPHLAAGAATAAAAAGGRRRARRGRHGARGAGELTPERRVAAEW
jgi:hypothetical protein